MYYLHVTAAFIELFSAAQFGNVFCHCQKVLNLALMYPAKREPPKQRFNLMVAYCHLRSQVPLIKFEKKINKNLRFDMRTTSFQFFFCFRHLNVHDINQSSSNLEL